VQAVHVGRLPFTDFSATLAARRFCRQMECPLMQPASNHHGAGQGAGVFCEADEDQLCYILGQLRVTADKSEGRRVDQVDVARDQLAKSGFTAVAGVFDEQCVVVGHSVLPVKPRRNGKPNKLST